MRRAQALVCILGALGILAGCQAKPKPAAEVRPPAAASGGGSQKSAALRKMEVVAAAAHKCWFASKDPAFRPYRFANELNSMSGQPRILLVPVRNFGGLPQLVVQSSGASGRVDVFGPLTSSRLGPRINGDISRWSNGDTSCSASA